VVWWNGLLRLGIAAPLVVVHDLGFILLRRGRRIEGGAGVLARYAALLDGAVAAAATEGLGTAALRDDVVTVLLARLLGDVVRRWRVDAPATMAQAALPLTSALYGQAPAALAATWPVDWALAFVQRLLDDQAGLLVRLEQLEVAPLRLLGLFPAGTAPVDLADLLALVTSGAAVDVADFSLALLPTLMETRRQSASQRFDIDGYAAIENRGSIDALLPSEIALDAETFAMKALSGELLYYAHERGQEGTRRSHGILIDASASMRGAREVFARGLALALAKKLTLRGDDTWLAYFDSRLHRRMAAAALGGKDLPYFLTFRSERGRNYGRVFTDVEAEVRRARARRDCEVAITFITHAECHAPTPMIAKLASQCLLSAVFVLPSRPLALDYLPLLHRHHVVTAETLARPAASRQRALQIVGDVTAAAGPGIVT